MLQMKIKISSLIFFCNLLLAGLLLDEVSVIAQESYLSQLLPGIEFSFQHLNLKSSEFTGKSHFNYEILTKAGTKFIVEKNENTKPDGKVFTRKTLWFDAESGLPNFYEEEDFREDFRITNSYSGEVMQTRLEKDGRVLEFETSLSQEKAVPFEVVIFYLRKNLQEILQTKDYSFTLFIPLLAIELGKKGFPRSMSMIRMMVEPQGEIQMETPLGVQTAQTILVLPESGLLRALLPREKTHFEFTFAAAAPHHLLQFEEGKTRHVLTHLILTE